MTNLVERIEALFAERFEAVAAGLRTRFPEYRVDVYRGPVGSLTSYQGYDLGVECVFPDVPRNRSNNVALSVDLCHLTTTPRVNASVGWGHPSGHCEADFREDWHSHAGWSEATPEVFEELASDVPRLIAAFEAAVERGYSSDAEYSAANGVSPAPEATSGR